MIHFVKKNPSLGCQKLGQIFDAGKTSVASISKDDENIRKEFEIFEDKQFIRDLTELVNISKEGSFKGIFDNQENTFSYNLSCRYNSEFLLFIL